MYTLTPLTQEGRLRTLSSGLESRKFISREDEATERPRKVYCLYTLNRYIV